MFRRSSVGAPALVLSLLLQACSPSSPSSPPTSSGSGGLATGKGGSTGTGGNGSGTGGSSTSTGGTSGSAGAGGSLAGSATGSGGSGGGPTGMGGGTGAGGAAGTGGTPTTGADASDAAPAPGEAGSGMMGMQGDPGIVGDGTVNLPGPNSLPPESRMLVNGAPKGQLIGPLLHTLKGTYPNWSAWKFSYWIYVPAQYKPGKAAAMMVFMDGALYSGAVSDAQFNTATVFDNLIHEGSMPVTIGVFIGTGSTSGQHVPGGDPGRSRQYDTPSDVFGKFVLTEFLPTNILNKYDIVTDPDGWAAGGHSSSGIAAFMMAWYYPDKFHKVLAASPSFSNTGGKFPAEVLKVTPAKPIRVYHLAVTQDLGGWLAANNQAAANFKQMGYHYRYRTGEGEHYPPAAARADFPDALRWLWRAYKLAP